MRRLLSFFVAPPEADRGMVRRAGARSVVVGGVLCAATFAVLLHDAAWFHGRILASPWRGAGVLVAVLAFGFAVQGGFRALTGVARGGDDGAPSAAARGIRVVYLLASAVGTLAVLFAGMVAITPPESAPEPAPLNLDVPMPTAGQREVQYRVGDATVTIERVTRDAAIVDATRRP